VKTQVMKAKPSMQISVIAVWTAMLVFLTGCSTVPITGRSQLNLISSSQEMQLGLSSFEKLKQETPINHDPAINSMVQRVGKRIAAVASPDMPNAQWEFVVFESKEANAFCLPGGKVGVYTGILPITKDDAGLATVIGHEVGHAVAHHGAERISEAMLLQTGGQLLGASISAADPRWQQVTLLAYGVGTTVGRELPHSRAQESEADHIGLIYMARAGYDPKAAIEFWQRFARYNQEHGGGSNSPLAGFLSTHPLDQTRIQQLQQWLPEAERVYRQAQGKAP
jgi:predicted Zn-dependent protease